MMTALLPARRQALEKLLSRLGLSRYGEEVNWLLLDQALVHPSLDSQINNDRLEFLGDAVLRIVVTECLYRYFPDRSVGDLSEIRSDLVSDAFLAEIADRYGLELFLALGSGAHQDRKGRPRRLADALEAVLGSLYLSWQERTIARLHPWLDPIMQERAHKLLADPVRGNPKAALQELTQRQWSQLPDYRLSRSQEHPPWFEVTVWVKGSLRGRGEGSSKKTAEMMAARQALFSLQAPPRTEDP
ncbi:MAG: ribonuclease III [Cyanobacteriota bacterium]|nr:ribonuclease III [Cyanobacteriota bacterium]